MLQDVHVEARVEIDALHVRFDGRQMAVSLLLVCLGGVLVLLDNAALAAVEGNEKHVEVFESALLVQLVRQALVCVLHEGTLAAWRVAQLHGVLVPGVDEGHAACLGPVVLPERLLEGLGQQLVGRLLAKHASEGGVLLTSV